MAEFSPNIPAVARTKAAVSPDKTSQVLSSLAATVSAYGNVTAKQLNEVKTAQAESDFVAQTINNDELEVSSAYSRTVRSMENEDWFSAINNGLLDAVDDPDHEFSKMDDAGFKKYLQDSIQQRTSKFANDQFGELHSNDFAGFISQNIIKLKANHAKIRRARNHENLINSTTEAVTRYFKEPTRGQEDVSKYLAALPGVASIDRKTWANIVASAAQVAAANGSDVGVKYIEQSMIDSNPELQAALNTAKQQYYKKIDELETTRIYNKAADKELLANNGMFTREDGEAVLEDPALFRAKGMDWVLGLLRTSQRNAVNNDNIAEIARKIREGQELTSVSADHSNKANDMVWEQFLAEEPNVTSAAAKYATVASKYGSFSPKFKGWFQRALTATEGLDPSATAPDSWFTAMLIAEELKESGKLNLLGLDEKTTLGLTYAMRTFDLAKSRTTNSTMPAEEAAGEAYKLYSTFMTKKDRGTLPAILNNRREFDKQVDNILKDKTEKFWFWQKDDAISQELRQALKDTAFNLGVTSNYDNIKDLVDSAWSTMEGSYGEFGGTKFREPALPLHNIMQVPKDQLSAVSDFFMQSKVVKETFPDTEQRDLLTEIIGTGNDAVVFLRSSTDPTIVPLQIKASEIGDAYHKDRIDKQAVKEADAAREMEIKRRYAKVRERGRAGHFAASIAPFGSRADFVSDEFKQLFNSSSPDTRYHLAVAFENWEKVHLKKDTPQEQTMMEEERKARAALTTKNIKELADKVLEVEDTLSTEIVSTELQMMLGVAPEAMQNVTSLTFAEAKDYAKTIKTMPELGIVPYLSQSVHTKALLTLNSIRFGVRDEEMPAEVYSQLNRYDSLVDEFGVDGYLTTLAQTMVEEGGFNPKDVYAPAYMGLNEKWTKDWTGWKTIHAILDDDKTYPDLQDKINAVNETMKDPDMRMSVAKWYKDKYYDYVNLERISDKTIRSLMFDHAVNAGPNNSALHARQALAEIGKHSKSNSVKPLTDSEARSIENNIDAFKKAFIPIMMKHYQGSKYTAGWVARKKRVIAAAEKTDVKKILNEYKAFVEARRAIKLREAAAGGGNTAGATGTTAAGTGQ